MSGSGAARAAEPRSVLFLNPNNFTYSLSSGWRAPLSSHYDGPWMRISPGHVPRALVKLLPHFRRVHPGRYRISHRELQADWGEWDRKKHWKQ